jgi:hypothetical protein
MMSQEISKKQGFGEWWFRLTAPQAPPNPTFAQREMVRRGRLGSMTISFISIFATLTLIQAILQRIPGFAISMIITLIINAVALFVLNRRGYLQAAGLLIIIVFDLGFALAILTAPSGLTYENLRSFDIMAVAVLLVVAFFPPRSVFIMALINTAFVLIWTIFGTHDQKIADILHLNAYSLFFPPLALEIYLAGMTFLWVSSAVKAIKDLDRTEEIVELERREIARQEDQLTVSKQIEDGIQQIITTMNTVATRNDFGIRVPLSQENILWRVGRSINNLLARLQGLKQDQEELKKTRVISVEIARHVKEGKPIKLENWTGTAFDIVIIEYNKLLQNQHKNANQLFSDPDHHTTPNAYSN